jgi:hypothetical protein
LFPLVVVFLGNVPIIDTINSNFNRGERILSFKKGLGVLTLLIMIGGLTSSFGCWPRIPEQARPTPQPPAKQLTAEAYFPLNPGSLWDYRGEGNEYAEYNSRVLFREGNLAQMRVDNPGTTMAFIFEVTDDSITRVYSEEGFYEERSLLGTFQENRREIILKRPFVEGTTWTEGDRTFTIVETNATVTTPAGVFNNCLKIHSTFRGSDHEIFQFYAPNVGLVRSEFIAADTLIMSELRKYEIK